MSLIGSLERKLQKIRIYTFSDYVPLIFFSEVTSPYFIIGEVKCNKLIEKKNNLDFKKWGGPGMCSTEHTKF